MVKECQIPQALCARGEYTSLVKGWSNLALIAGLIRLLCTTWDLWCCIEDSHSELKHPKLSPATLGSQPPFVCLTFGLTREEVCVRRRLPGTVLILHADLKNKVCYGELLP